ncbi:putative inhibitor of MCP methylation [Gottschalkia purinilytica]|uniref:Putative inhibitor of MCP methylation n=1 Tax=Gottschalkia purinilytica TaxID=1503 RepID=A0A0L0WF76_GOTPU|nr:hypothetical protein [Gottschalkia purinilytica]KNF10137.1 putative inhibitor of MCP methylation [Gottschalkia purinilytica]
MCKGGISIVYTDIVKAFRENSKDIIKQLLNIDLLDKKVEVQDYIFFNNHITVISGVIIDDVSFQFTISMPKELGLTIASKILGVPIVIIDESCINIILEMTKLIIGNSCLKLKHEETYPKMTSIGVIYGDNYRYMLDDGKIVYIPFSLFEQEFIIAFGPIQFHE